jgi:UDP-N-acetyl-2-amino-2-deoxyglucuronate dehydrogenase
MVGVGGFGAYRRERLREAGGFELVAVCDRDPGVARQAAEEERAQPFADVAAMLAEPLDLVGVIIATGASSHAPLAVQAMAAGKHVFIEKPLCSTPEQAAALLAAQRASGVHVGVGHAAVEDDGAVLVVEQLRREGRFGTLVCYEENTSHSGGLILKDGDWRADPAHNPGGMLFQCGVHSLHRLIHLFGPVVAVQAMMRDDAHPGTRTVDVANVLLRHASGMVGTLNAYHVTPYCHELRVFGTSGAAFIETHDGRGQATFQVRRQGDPEPREPLPLPERPVGAGGNNLIAWRDAIRGTRARPAPGLEDGLRAVAPVFAAMRAAQEGREMALDALYAEWGWSSPTRACA